MNAHETTTARDLLTVRDAARRLAIHPETCRRLIRQGRIPAVQVGGSTRVDPVVLDRWLAEQRTSAA